jgi:hypothetical protein
MDDIWGEGGTCSKCRVGHQDWNNLSTQLFATATSMKLPFVSRSPTVLWLVITGDIGF